MSDAYYNFLVNEYENQGVVQSGDGFLSFARGKLCYLPNHHFACLALGRRFLLPLLPHLMSAATTMGTDIIHDMTTNPNQKFGESFKRNAKRNAGQFAKNALNVAASNISGAGRKRKIKRKPKRKPIKLSKY